MEGQVPMQPRGRRGPSLSSLPCECRVGGAAFLPRLEHCRRNPHDTFSVEPGTRQVHLGEGELDRRRS